MAIRPMSICHMGARTNERPEPGGQVAQDHYARAMSNFFTAFFQTLEREARNPDSFAFGSAHSPPPWTKLPPLFFFDGVKIPASAAAAAHLSSTFSSSCPVSSALSLLSRPLSTTTTTPGPELVLFRFTIIVLSTFLAGRPPSPPLSENCLPNNLPSFLSNEGNGGSAAGLPGGVDKLRSVPPVGPRLRGLTLLPLQDLAAAGTDR
mgnify:CR=1 FL=1